MGSLILRVIPEIRSNDYIHLTNGETEQSWLSSTHVKSILYSSTISTRSACCQNIIYSMFVCINIICFILLTYYFSCISQFLFLSYFSFCNIFKKKFIDQDIFLWETILSNLKFFMLHPHS